MRIVYMGSPACAIAPLAHLLAEGAAQGHQIIAVVSQEAKRVGRSSRSELSDPPVAQFAKEKGLLTLQPAKAKDPDFLKQLRALKPEIIVTCAYGQILTQEFLSIPQRATINIHPSKLPKYRGAIPVQAALLAGETRTAVSILFTVKELDAGALILQKEFDIEPNETADTLMARLFKEAGPLLLEALTKLSDPQFGGEKQDESQVSHCKKIEKTDGLVLWDTNTLEIYRRYRAFDPWPGSFTFFRQKRVVLEQLEPCAADIPSNTKQSPGSFHFAKPLGALVVKTGDSWISVKKIKPEGSRSLDAVSFWNGFALKQGQGDEGVQFDQA